MGYDRQSTRLTLLIIESELVKLGRRPYAASVVIPNSCAFNQAILAVYSDEFLGGSNDEYEMR